jgi:predicted small metal-binding protein
VFVDTRETFAAVLGDFKAAEAKRLEAIQRASSAFANAQKDMLPGVEQIVIDHAKHGGKATTKGESEIQEDLMNQVQAAIMAVQDTAAARMITMEAIEAAASPTAGDALLNGLAPLDAPLSTPLVMSAVVFEAKHAKWPTKDQWCNVLGVRTRDKYMHLFFLSGEFDASLSAEDALRQITPALELKHDKKGKVHCDAGAAGLTLLRMVALRPHSPYPAHRP